MLSFNRTKLATTFVAALVWISNLAVPAISFAGSLKTPTSIAASTTSSTQINVSWQSASGGTQTGYHLDRSTSSTFSTAVSTFTVAGTSYSNTGLSPSTTYYFRVRAYSGSVDSGNSSTVSAKTLADTSAPTTPSGLTATTASSSQINLSWSASTDTGGSG